MEQNRPFIPLWQKPESSADVGKIERLKNRYALLRQLIVEFRKDMPWRDPERHLIAPPAAIYLDALDRETAWKSLDEMGKFVDKQLADALSNFRVEHPIRARLKEAYLKGVSGLMPVVVAKVKEGEPFDELLAFLAHTRMVLAETVCDIPSFKFGRPREGAELHIARTHFTYGRRFEAYLKDILALVPEGKKEFTISEAFNALVGEESVPDIDGFTNWATLEGQTIPLSTYLVCRKHPTNPDMLWLFGKLDRGALIYPTATILHTDAKYIPCVKAACKKLYDGIRSGMLSKDALVPSIAEFQWLLAHGMFYFRGSAAIAEWLCRALFQVNGLAVTWLQQPDLQALIRPDRGDFIRDYQQFTTMVKY